MKFRVIGQQIPYNCTAPQVIIVDAENKNGAFIQAYNDFTQKGYNVETHSLNLKNISVDSSVVQPKLPPRYWTTQMLVVQSIEEIKL